LNGIAFPLVTCTPTRPQPIGQAPCSMEKGESLLNLDPRLTLRMAADTQFAPQQIQRRSG
jgi:hypothetical protein